MRSRTVFAALVLLAVSIWAVPRLSAAERLVPLPAARRDLVSTAEHVVVTQPEFTGSLGNLARRPGYLAYAQRLAARLREPLTRVDLAEAEDLVLSRLHDPHTSLEGTWNPLSSPDLLPVGFYWAQGGLVAYRVQGSPAALRTGDRVLALGGVPAQAILRRAQRFFSGNVPWLKTLTGQDLPFGNTLRWLGLVHGDAVQVELARPSGERYDLTVRLVPQSLAADRSYTLGRDAFLSRYLAPSGMAEPVGRSFYAWRLTPDYGVFWITSSSDTTGYQAAVDAFFRAVRTAGVYYAVIDLGENPGGYASVAYPLLEHLPLRPAYAAALPGDVRDQNPAEVFHGKVYVLVDGSTMSAAVFSAEMLSEMSDAVLIGEPAGMASGALVGAKNFKTPDGIFGYHVSTVYATPVNGVVTAALEPSAALPLTVRDIQQGIDPVARWLSHLATPRVKT